MPILQVRELPQALYNKLAREAKKEHRSLSQQAITELARSLNLSLTGKERREKALMELHQWQKEKNIKETKDPVQLIREDRAR